MTSPVHRSDSLPPGLKLAFAPLHKRAFGSALGITASVIVFALTLVELARGSGDASPLRLLSQYFAGYEVSLRGAIIGALWALATGFVAGWFVAFCRNLVVAASIFWIRTRAQLAATREFLDHI